MRISFHLIDDKTLKKPDYRLILLQTEKRKNEEIIYCETLEKQLTEKQNNIQVSRFM